MENPPSQINCSGPQLKIHTQNLVVFSKATLQLLGIFVTHQYRCCLNTIIQVETPLRHKYILTHNVHYTPSITVTGILLTVGQEIKYFKFWLDIFENVQQWKVDLRVTGKK
jgi:hypothetical protein